MGFLQILVSAGSIALTYGGMVGADLLMESLVTIEAEQPVADSVQHEDGGIRSAEAVDSA